MDGRNTPPYTAGNTPEPTLTGYMTPVPDMTTLSVNTPTSIGTSSSNVAPPTSTPIIPKDLTQPIVDADPLLKRFQQDLLILTSFNENETLHWRPSWFQQGPHAQRFWTLHNPPNVVTSYLPHIPKGQRYFTRRARTANDAPPYFIKTWAHWLRYCTLYGIPHDLLCEDHLRLLWLGLLRDERGELCGTHPPLHNTTKRDHTANKHSTTIPPPLPRAPTTISRPLHPLPIHIPHTPPR
jgi:hypothetical protein